MKNLTTHRGRLDIIERLPNSRNGNPRYLARVDGYTFRTTLDSSYGYKLTNYDGKLVKVQLGTHYGVLSLDALWTL